VLSFTPYTKINYNANYGPEVRQKLDMILEAIDGSKEKSMILVTDLNLTADESRWIDAEVRKRNENKADIHLVLLDHHGTGEESAKLYSWYTLDTLRSATKITYDYAKEFFTLNEPEWLCAFVDVVNAVDLWKQEERENFEYGKVCMRLISETRELNKIMFPKEDNDYKISLLKKAASYFSQPDAPIVLDEKIHLLKKEFFKEDKNDTLDNLATKYIVNLLGMKKEEMTIYYKGYRGFMSYALGNTSIIGNGFLVAHPEYDFIVDVSYKGTLSLRANNQVNVAILAKEIANGGGHPNAAGGRILGFKEQFVYDKAKQQIEALLSDKEATTRELAAK
jgi:oligoribonuclease NrnB/cAMP/cGMP phosphodiesterase (DHH superfamily)